MSEIKNDIVSHLSGQIGGIIVSIQDQKTWDSSNNGVYWPIVHSMDARSMIYAQLIEDYKWV